MRSAPSGCALARALVLASLWLAVAGRPLARRSLALSDQGPHLYYGWDQPIRLRHLYAAGPYGFSNCFLRIRTDGAVDCEEKQSEHSKSPPGAPHPAPPTHRRVPSQCASSPGLPQLLGVPRNSQKLQFSAP